MSRDVIVEMTMAEAEQYRDRLADLLCWLSGFCAAREGTSLDSEMPMGMSATRDLSLRIKRAIDDATEEKR